MSFTANWTDEAILTLNENIEYLRRNWDLAAINNFLDRVDEVIEAIEENPNLYPVYRKVDDVHKCVLNKSITLYYRVVSPSQIDLITFWNTHKNPTGLTL
ncbi:MAG: type II toxin-antitoxin system RelE/ParE family toxin [Bacteroidota bacterium]